MILKELLYSLCLMFNVKCFLYCLTVFDWKWSDYNKRHIITLLTWTRFRSVSWSQRLSCNCNLPWSVRWKYKCFLHNSSVTEFFCILCNMLQLTAICVALNMCRVLSCMMGHTETGTITVIDCCISEENDRCHFKHLGTSSGYIMKVICY